MPNLILIPTTGERDIIEARLDLRDSTWQCATVGFGAVASAVETIRLIQQHQPRRVILAGIAGLFSGQVTDDVCLGSARWFGRLHFEGIGVGQGDDYRDASELGWQWVHPESQTAPPELRCQTPDADPAGALLTVCSASAGTLDAQRRSIRFPDAIGEDMESFSVGLACHRSGVDLMVVRGFSNLVGQRDKSHWQIQPALDSAACLLNQVIRRDDP